MAALAEKLHSFFTRLRGGVDVAAHDVEEVVAEVTTHLNETILPAIENTLTEILPAAVQKAIADALSAERGEAARIAAKLEEVYKKIVEEHGADTANTAMAQAMAPEAPAEAPAV
jgi:hypothetical protein